MTIFIGLTILAEVFALFKPFDCVREFCAGGYIAVKNNDDNNNVTEDGLLQEEYLVEVVSNDAKQYLTRSDEMMIRQLDRAKVTFQQVNMGVKLSDGDQCRVFLYEENDIKADETLEQLIAKVQHIVNEYSGEQRDNVFDKNPNQGGAPQDIRNEISLASDTEDEWSSFSDVEERLDLRESINHLYPKRTLTQLVANDYQWLALLLVWYGGEKSTIIYYYGQSILYDFECLKYADNTDRLIKQKLLTIAQRYEDIAYVCPDFEDVERARSLAVAFRYVADQY